MKFKDFIDEALTLKAKTDDNVLQRIRQDLTRLSSVAAELKKSKNKDLGKVAKEVEIKIDEIRRIIFNFNG